MASLLKSISSIFTQRYQQTLKNPKIMIYELALVSGVIVVYQLAQFAVNAESAKEPSSRDDAVAIKIGYYLPKSYNPPIKTLPIPDKMKQAINNPIMDKSILYPNE